MSGLSSFSPYFHTKSCYPLLPLGLRGPQSQTGTTILGSLKGPKFFTQFQIARVQTALGQTLGVADTVEHQLGKVVKVSLVPCTVPRRSEQYLSTDLLAVHRCLFACPSSLERRGSYLSRDSASFGVGYAGLSVELVASVIALCAGRWSAVWDRPSIGDVRESGGPVFSLG